MKIFLTGGTGYLGSALRDALLREGHELTVMARRPPAMAENPSLRWIRGDLAAGPPPAEFLGRHGAVIHSAAMVRTWARDRTEFDRVNVGAWDDLLSACARAEVPKIIHTSSFISLGPSVDGRPLRESDRRPRSEFATDYERTKYLADLVTDRWIAQGAPVSTLYPGVIFGPGGRTDGNLVGKLIFSIVRRRFPGIPGSGRQVWSFAFLPDVVAGHLAALQRAVPGQGYILGGENVSLGAFTEQVHRVLERPYRERHVPLRLVEALGRLLEWGAYLTGKPPELTRGVARVYRWDWTYDSSKAARELGYEVTPFVTALEETVRWVQGLRRWRA